MQNIYIPHTAVPSDLSGRIRLAVVSSTECPPEGLGWLHEVKYDGHRLAAILDGSGGLKLISRNGNDRTPLFRAPFDGLLSAGRELVFDGEIAVPDNRGVTHISDLQDAIAERRPERLAYFAFDLLRLGGHDLRSCATEARKELLRRVLEEARCPRLVYVDHVTGRGAELFEHVQAVGGEGIVSKRIGSRYRAKRLGFHPCSTLLWHTARMPDEDQLYIDVPPYTPPRPVTDMLPADLIASRLAELPTRKEMYR